RAEQLALNAGQEFVELGEVPAAGRSDADHVAAAVGRVGGTLDEAAINELVEGCHHVASIEIGMAAELDLAAGTELPERREQTVVVRTRVFCVERVDEQAVRVHRGLAEKPAGLLSKCCRS